MSSYEYHQLLQYLYFEGYADSYEEAEYITEQLTDEEFDDLTEARRRRLAHSFPLPPSALRSVDNIRKRLENPDGPYIPYEGEKTSKTSPTRSSRGREEPEPPEPVPVPEPKRRSRTTNLKNVIIAQYLYNEGYAETLQSAEIMSESISEEWVNEILEISEARYWYQDKSPEAQERFTKPAMKRSRAIR